MTELGEGEMVSVPVDTVESAMKGVIDAMLADGPQGAAIVIVLNHNGEVTMQSKYSPEDTVRWLYQFGMDILSNYERGDWVTGPPSELEPELPDLE